jgi:hypothetical protein
VIRFILSALFVTSLVSSAKAQMTAFCLPGQSGVINCPCGNPPTNSGSGCNNFGPTPPGGTGGATLDANGSAIADPANNVQFVITGEQGSLTVLFCGTTALPSGVISGAGVRCVGGSLIRSYSGSPTLGAILFPNPSSPTDAWTASGSPGSGTTRYYYAVYRNMEAVTPCGSSSSNFNTTNAGSLTWL